MKFIKKTELDKHIKLKHNDSNTKGKPSKKPSTKNLKLTPVEVEDEVVQEVVAAKTKSRRASANSTDYWICTKCHEPVTSESALIKHMKRDHFENCTICEKSFVSKSALLRHNFHSHGIKSNQLKECKECFSYFESKSFKSHSKVLHDVKCPYQGCPVKANNDGIFQHKILKHNFGTCRNLPMKDLRTNGTEGSVNDEIVDNEMEVHHEENEVKASIEKVLKREMENLSHENPYNLPMEPEVIEPAQESLLDIRDDLHKSICGSEDVPSLVSSVVSSSPSSNVSLSTSVIMHTSSLKSSSHIPVKPEPINSQPMVCPNETETRLKQEPNTIVETSNSSIIPPVSTHNYLPPESDFPLTDIRVPVFNQTASDALSSDEPTRSLPSVSSNVPTDNVPELVNDEDVNNDDGEDIQTNGGNDDPDTGQCDVPQLSDDDYDPSDAYMEYEDDDETNPDVVDVAPDAADVAPDAVVQEGGEGHDEDFNACMGLDDEEGQSEQDISKLDAYMNQEDKEVRSDSYMDEETRPNVDVQHQEEGLQYDDDNGASEALVEHEEDAKYVPVVEDVEMEQIDDIPQHDEDHEVSTELTQTVPTDVPYNSKADIDPPIIINPHISPSNEAHVKSEDNPCPVAPSNVQKNHMDSHGLSPCSAEAETGELSARDQPNLDVKQESTFETSTEPPSATKTPSASPKLEECSQCCRLFSARELRTHVRKTHSHSCGYHGCHLRFIKEIERDHHMFR